MRDHSEESRTNLASSARSVVAAAIVCAAVTLLAWPLAASLDHANIVMVYLLAVVGVALRFGRLAGITSAFLGVLSFDYFFVEPRFSFAVQDVQYLITFAVMLVVALLIATQTARLRAEADQAALREARTRALYRLAQEISGAFETTQIRDRVAAFLAGEFGVETTMLLLEPDGHLAPVGAAQAGEPSPAKVAEQVIASGHPAPFIDANTSAVALVLPLAAPFQRRGVLVAWTRRRDYVVTNVQRPLLDAVAALATTAIERVHYVEVARQVQVDMESERLRSVVLSAVSHDLRTPLTVVVGLADTLNQPGSDLEPGQARIAAALRDEAMRMSRLVENLLDMARLRSGRVQLRKAWQPLEEVVGSAVGAVEASFPGRKIAIALDADLPPLEFDGTLVERVLVNLLENAIKYGGPGPIAIHGMRRGAEVEIQVNDTGSGFPAGDNDRLFEMFERGSAEPAASGTGLGLAICKAIVEAHGGSITATNRTDGGASVVVRLPATDPPASLEASLEASLRATAGPR